MLHHTAVARWDTGKLLRIIASVAEGMQHLHTFAPPVLHRDLKPGNIFVSTGQVRSFPRPMRLRGPIRPNAIPRPSSAPSVQEAGQHIRVDTAGAHP